MRTITVMRIMSACLIVLGLTACFNQATEGISPKFMADNLHKIITLNSHTYVSLVVERLAAREGVIKVSEHWKDDKALPLPFQMLSHTEKLLKNDNTDFTYSLISKWPINKDNKAETILEKTGIDYIGQNKNHNFYSNEILNGQKYFLAMYPFIAKAPVCASCHNGHKESSKKDFVLGDVMGGIVIRIALDSHIK